VKVKSEICTVRELVSRELEQESDKYRLIAFKKLVPLGTENCWNLMDT
jgi:hypothetical protein